MSHLVLEDRVAVEELDQEGRTSIRGGIGRNVLGAAFKIDWKVGKALDSEYGISDAIAGTDDYDIVTDGVKNAGNPK